MGFPQSCCQGYLVVDDRADMVVPRPRHFQGSTKQQLCHLGMSSSLVVPTVWWDGAKSTGALIGISLVLRRRRRRLPVSGTSKLVLRTTQAVPCVKSVLTLAAVPVLDCQCESTLPAHVT
jgi:hypothetical protein